MDAQGDSDADLTVRALLLEARRRLAEAPFAPSGREATLLLGHVLGQRESTLLAFDERSVAVAETRRFHGLLARRLAGEPIAYLLGEREFYGRPFEVDRRVLIPRPETEHLVEAALTSAATDAPRIVDVGTGSGCIAVTLACERPDARVVATDRSPAALVVARRNAARHGVSSRISWLATDLANGLRATRIDLLVSNPPYIDPAESSRLSPEVVAHEPGLALFAPDRGRGLIEHLLGYAAALRPGTPIVLEIGYDQADWLAARVNATPHLALDRIIEDYAGVPRTAVLVRTT